MKTVSSFRTGAGVMLAGAMFATWCSGQGLGVSGGGGNVNGGANVEFGPPKRAEPKTIRYELTVVGKPREWTNTTGTKITAALVAFPKAPGAEKNTPIEILKDGKIRLLRGEDYRNVAEYPIEKLSEADQEFVSNLALNIRLAADAEREKAEEAAIAAEELKERLDEEGAKTEAKAKEIFN